MKTCLYVMIVAAFVLIRLPAHALDMHGLLRGYYVNDQRIHWTGLESSFGAEGQFKMQHEISGFEANLLLNLNQMYDPNRLRDNGVASYTDNYGVRFDNGPLEIENLNVGYMAGGLTIRAGKAESPFGRHYFDVYSNSRSDAPFIRTEAVLWQETGLFINYKKGIFDIDLALVNGSEDRDTNSSKAGMARIGFGGSRWAFGVSGKKQDGIGSENQKYFKNHYGLDFMARGDNIIVSGEAIFDEYGFRKNYLEDPDYTTYGIFWGGSLYYRDVFYKYKTPVTGIGGYLDIAYEGEVFQASINYGQYHPQEIGKPYHDEPVKRGIARLIFFINGHTSIFFAGLLENERPVPYYLITRSGGMLLVGIGHDF